MPTRPSPSARGYDADWMALRARFLRGHPVCSRPGCDAPSRVVDHILPVSARPDLRLNVANLRALCARCHNRRSMIDQLTGERSVTSAAAADGTPLDPRHPWHNQGVVVAAPLSAYGLSLDTVSQRFRRLGETPEAAEPLPLSSLVALPR